MKGVASVTEDGQVVARANGETDIEVTYAGYTATAHVVVDSIGGGGAAGGAAGLSPSFLAWEARCGWAWRAC